MEQYKKEFIDFMVECNVLKFGSFTLKSGRKSPFFMNAGAYITGSQLERLGEFYAKAIHDNFGDNFDVLFGPAYKGIPLSVATCIAYSKLYNKEIKYPHIESHLFSRQCVGEHSIRHGQNAAPRNSDAHHGENQSVFGKLYAK